MCTLGPGLHSRPSCSTQSAPSVHMLAHECPLVQVRLCSVGYNKFADLAKKFRTLYAVSVEQLSKQKHYDFGLRNVLAVLRSAGRSPCACVSDSGVVECVLSGCGLPSLF